MVKVSFVTDSQLVSYAPKDLKREGFIAPKKAGNMFPA